MERNRYEQLMKKYPSKTGTEILKMVEDEKVAIKNKRIKEVQDRKDLIERIQTRPIYYKSKIGGLMRWFKTNGMTDKTNKYVRYDEIILDHGDTYGFEKVKLVRNNTQSIGYMETLTEVTGSSYEGLLTVLENIKNDY